jgi:hypothetical protein
LEEAAGRDLVRDAVLGDVGQAAAEVGIEANTSEAAEVAETLREGGLGR